MLKGISHPPPQQAAVPDAAAARSGLRLSPGDIFRATVVEVRGDGNYLLAARGSRFPAFAARPLQVGQNHIFQVSSSGERLTLHVLEGERTARTSAVRLWASGRPARAELGRILENLSRAAGDRDLNKGVRDALVRLKERLPGMVYRAPGGDGAGWLLRQLKDSGLFFESKAALLLVQGKDSALQTLGTSDLKGILLALKAALGNKNAPGSTEAELAGQVARGLHLIQQDQILNLNAWKEGLGWFWFIPGHPDRDFRGGELFAGKSGTDDDEYFLSLSVDFSMLGRMDFGVSLARKTVNIRILAEMKSTADLINEHTPDLREHLASAGLKPGKLLCRRRHGDDPPWTPFLDAVGTSGAVDLVT